MSLIITDAEPRGLGYVEIDHRSAGELPLGTPRHFEADTYTCTHCNRVVFLNPSRKRERYKCKGCNHHICDDCAAQMATGAECYTFARRVEDYMEQVARQTGSGLIILP